MSRTLEQIDRDLATQRTNLHLAMAEPMRQVILGRIDRLLEERVAVAEVAPA